MKLADYAIDDLHQAALAEFEGDPHAEELFNRVYDSLQAEYILTMQLVRERTRGGRP
jgi:hypothetical protein